VEAAAELALGSAPRRCLDLGSGAGLPGLVIAALRPTWQVLLLEGGTRRAAWLEEATGLIGAQAQVQVVARRAEDAAHDPGLRRSIDVVVARSFGPPPVTAECAAGFLRVGGLLVVSEPPGPPTDRWPRDGLDTLGLAPLFRLMQPDAQFQVLVQGAPCPDRYPRRVGVPAKRPIF
jgi:16S rRNA (guanine527-N7)-methyltransferase